MADRPRLTLRHLRLGAGEVLWLYIAWHFVNHALGLISLDTAEAGLRLATAVWQSWPGTLLLYGAFGVHLALALSALHQRTTLNMPPLEWLRVGFGLTIPLLLLGHVVQTRIAFSLYGQPAQYARVVESLQRAGSVGLQLALLAPGWMHGCMGLHMAFRHRPWFARARPWLMAFAIALPLVAAAGYAAMNREVIALTERQARFGPPTTRSTLQPEQRRQLTTLRSQLLVGYLGVLVAVFAARGWREWRRARGAPRIG